MSHGSIKTLVALDDALLAVMLRALVKYQATATNNGETAIVVEAARQIQVALDMLAMAKDAAPK